MITTEQATIYFIESLIRELKYQYIQDTSIPFSEDDFIKQGLRKAAEEIINTNKLNDLEKRIDEVSKNMSVRPIPRRGCR